MYLVLGDESHDGHGQCEKVLLNSEKSVDDVRLAYKAACLLTGVEFDHQVPSYTGLARDFREQLEFSVATEYEMSWVPAAAVEVLKKHGLDDELKTWDWCVFNKKGNLDLDADNYVKLWIWFVHLADPDLKLTRVNDTTPEINDDRDLRVQFGYGLYTQ